MRHQLFQRHYCPFLLTHAFSDLLGRSKAQVWPDTRTIKYYYQWNTKQFCGYERICSLYCVQEYNGLLKEFTSLTENYKEEDSFVDNWMDRIPLLYPMILSLVFFYFRIAGLEFQTFNSNWLRSWISNNTVKFDI